MRRRTMYWVIDAPLHGAYFLPLGTTQAFYATIARILSRRHPKFKGLQTQVSNRHDGQPRFADSPVSVARETAPRKQGRRAAAPYS